MWAAIISALQYWAPNYCYLQIVLKSILWKILSLLLNCRRGYRASPTWFWPPVFYYSNPLQGQWPKGLKYFDFGKYIAGVIIIFRNFPGVANPGKSIYPRSQTPMRIELKSPWDQSPGDANPKGVYLPGSHTRESQQSFFPVYIYTVTDTWAIYSYIRLLWNKPLSPVGMLRLKGKP